MDDPHADQPVHRAGATLASARAAGILVHGRGGEAANMLRLAEMFGVSDIAWLAPQAAGNVWYPRRFMEPLADNEPYLSFALDRIGTLVTEIEEIGIAADRIALIGFSQGACLVSEYAARNPRRWGLIGALSGGLIGPPGTCFDYPGSLEGTPALVGCSDVDPHIPVERVRETASVLRALGAEVSERIDPGLAHTVNDAEVVWLHEHLQGLTA